MTPELKRATVLQHRVHHATYEANYVVRLLTSDDFLDAPPDLRERMVEMADACEAFVRAWQRRDG